MVTFWPVIFLVRYTAGILDFETSEISAQARQGLHVDAGNSETEEFELTLPERLINQLFGGALRSFPQSSCQTDFMDIVGGDIVDATRAGQQTQSSKQCQRRCQNKLGCFYWAWHRLSGNCWLKRSDSLRFPNPMSVIGPKFCRLPPQTREQCATITSQKPDQPCETSSPYQQISGRCNNVKFPDWGAADIPFIRLATPQYAESGNGNAPRRSKLDSELLNTRTIAAAFPEHNNPDTRVTSMMMQFGQFLDHDISSTSFPEKRCCVTPGRPECFNIYVSSGDVTFTQRHNSSATCIDFARSRPACGLKQREQVNTITSFIDASNVYGSDVETADVLRSKTGGKLIENSKAPGQLPTKEQLNRLSDHLDDRLDFVAGDSRVNEQPFLTGLHVLFVREHNRLAERLQKDLQVDNDELLYQSARKLVIVEMQNIAYKEFLPVLLGQRFVKKYKLAVNKVSKYNEKVNPSLFNSFAGAAFRFGHSMINGLFKVIISNKEIFWRLSDLFNGNKFNGNNMLEIEPMIEGLLKQNAQKVDGSFADELTNHLFSEHSPKRHDRFGGDLVARNIQRGRDHGLPGYNTFRRICGLNPVTSFAKRPQEIPHHIWRRLKSLYKHVDDIDVYPAGISETPLDRDSLLGPTFSCLIGLQFHNLKFGDSFFFSHDRPSPNYIKDLLEEMKSRRLSNVICDNTKIVEVQVNAMEAPNNVTNPIKECRRETSLTPRSLVFPEDSEKETPKDLEKETPEAPEEEGTDSKPVRFTEEDAMATEDDLSGVEP